MRYADVIIDIAHANVDRIFQYRIPEDMRIEEGQRVIVPFGRGNACKEGYVTRLSDIPGVEESRIKPILRKAEGYTALIPEQIRLAAWMSKKYHCMMVEALRLMIPSQMRGSRVREKIMDVAYLNIDGSALEQAKLRLSGEGARKAPLQLNIVQMLESTGQMAVSDIAAFVPGGRAAVEALKKKGIVATCDIAVRRRPYIAAGEGSGCRHLLTQYQQNAVDTITQAIQKGEGTFLLHGITGSGKTEVYLKAIEYCLNTGKNAIVLVPEISLTPQMVSRFRERFGDEVAVMHSRLSAGERFDEWKRAREGSARVVIGPRSALFAPVNNIGLIVIDEEHEQSYRNEQRPQFESKEIAEFRCRDSRAVLVLGSATPSVPTYYEASRGKIQLLEMPERITSQGLAKVTVIDMREELKKGNRSIFSSSLYNSIKTCLDKKEQLMLFINRRGYSTFLMCRGCGYVAGCDDCDISLTYHKYKENAELRCHYCGKHKQVPAVCPECGKPYLKQFGVGTQQVEEQVKLQFPEARVIRMDMDTTRQKDAHQKLLETFGKGGADILIGTQMIAKGLDFSTVTLVGVVAADSTLFLPDYRSSERTFSLLMQVAGRAGRDKLPGTVVIQTYNPDHYAIMEAANQDYRSFYQMEIQNRKFAQLPPFSVYVRLLLRGQERDISAASKKAYLEIAGYLKQNGIKPLQFEHGPAPIARIKGEARARVLIKLAMDENTERIVSDIYSLFEGTMYCGCSSFMETNPSNML